MNEDITKRIEKAKIASFMNSAEGYMLLGMYEDALEAISYVIQREPENEKALYYDGLLSIQLNRTGRAENVFLTLLGKHPDKPELYVHLAYIYRRTKGLDEAIETIRKALEIEPLMALANYNLACYYSQRNQVTPAVRHLERAIKTESQYRNEAKEDNDFDPIRNHPAFQKLLMYKKS